MCDAFVLRKFHSCFYRCTSVHLSTCFHPCTRTGRELFSIGHRFLITPTQILFSTGSARYRRQAVCTSICHLWCEAYATRSCLWAARSLQEPHCVCNRNLLSSFISSSVTRYPQFRLRFSALGHHSDCGRQCAVVTGNWIIR